jgi:hypothetical protein
MILKVHKSKPTLSDKVKACVYIFKGYGVMFDCRFKNRNIGVEQTKPHYSQFNLFGEHR